MRLASLFFCLVVLSTGSVYAHDLVRIPGKGLDKKDLFLSREAASSYLDLLEHANRDGLQLRVNYAYRTNKLQRRIYIRNLRRCEKYGKESPYCVPVALPGKSTHNLGISIDIADTFRDYTLLEVESLSEKRKERIKKSCKKMSDIYRCRTVLYWWLKKNAPRHGFYADVRGEYWHWTFLGEGDL